MWNVDFCTEKSKCPYAVLFHSRVLILQKTKRWNIVFSF